MLTEVGVGSIMQTSTV